MGFTSGGYQLSKKRSKVNGVSTTLWRAVLINWSIGSIAGEREEQQPWVVFFFATSSYLYIQSKQSLKQSNVRLETSSHLSDSLSWYIIDLDMYIIPTRTLRKPAKDASLAPILDILPLVTFVARYSIIKHLKLSIIKHATAAAPIT